MLNFKLRKQENDFELEIKVGANNSNSSFWLKLYGLILSLGTVFELFKHFVL